MDKIHQHNFKQGAHHTDEYWYYLLDDIANEFIGDMFEHDDYQCRTIMEGVLQVYNTGHIKTHELSLKELCEFAARMIVMNPVEFKQDCILIAKVRYNIEPSIQE